ncbi:unnamed protein product, partial [Brachionus calyciflorus]
MEGTRHNLLVTRSERDLGVQIRDDLKWEDQVNIAVNKSNRALGLILEYAVSVWSPFLKKDVNAMENIQRRATILVKNIREMPYELRLKELEIQSLFERRERGDLIQMFKLRKGIDSVNLIKGIN